MKLLVAVKRTPDPEAKIRVKPDGNGIVTEQLRRRFGSKRSLAVRSLFFRSVLRRPPNK